MYIKMNEIECETITEKMEQVLRKIENCDFYITNGELHPAGKKNLARSIVEYDMLSRLSESSDKLAEIREKYKDIIETYGLR